MASPASNTRTPLLLRIPEHIETTPYPDIPPLSTPLPGATANPDANRLATDDSTTRTGAIASQAISQVNTSSTRTQGGSADISLQSTSSLSSSGTPTSGNSRIIFNDRIYDVTISFNNKDLDPSKNHANWEIAARKVLNYLESKGLLPEKVNNEVKVDFGKGEVSTKASGETKYSPLVLSAPNASEQIKTYFRDNLLSSFQDVEKTEPVSEENSSRKPAPVNKDHPSGEDAIPGGVREAIGELKNSTAQLTFNTIGWLIEYQKSVNLQTYNALSNPREDPFKFEHEVLFKDCRTSTEKQKVSLFEGLTVPNINTGRAVNTAGSRKPELFENADCYRVFINTGNHWIALYAGNDNTLVYIDSLGKSIEECPVDIEDIYQQMFGPDADSSGKIIRFYQDPIQTGTDSYSCGLHAFRAVQHLDKMLIHQHSGEDLDLSENTINQYRSDLANKLQNAAISNSSTLGLFSSSFNPRLSSALRSTTPLDSTASNTPTSNASSLTTPEPLPETTTAPTPAPTGGWWNSIKRAPGRALSWLGSWF
jgi:hypothetical protein